MERLRSLDAGQKFCEFPPNCLQFKSLCLAFYEDLRLPKAQDAYMEVKKRAYCESLNWSHPVVKFTAMRLPQNFHAIEQEHMAYGLFKKAYEQVCDLVKQGHELPKMPEVVMVQKSTNKGLAHRYLKQMKQQLGAC